MNISFANTPASPAVPEISPGELFVLLSAGDPVQVVDVRSPERVAAGRIHLVPDGQFRNIAGSALLGTAELGGTGIDPSVPVVVVCGHGNDSRVCAAHINALGARAFSLSGGMASWMNLCFSRLLPHPDGLDRLVQIDRVGKGSLGYVLISGGEALIIDPGRDASPYLGAIESSGGKLVAVADTHLHADYVSGAQALSRKFGVPYYLHPADAVSPYDGAAGLLDFTPMHEGMALPVGRVSLRVVHTPGHSPGSVTFMLGNEAAFTGDFLFVDSLGRPDLADRTGEWSPLLWKSLQDAMDAWPPGLVIYPAHYNSDRERNHAGAVSAKFGDLRMQNHPLQIADEDSFMLWIRENESAVPPSYRRIKEINLGLRGASEREFDELESGKNQCALGGI